MIPVRQIQTHQIKIIWAIAKQLGLDKDDVHAMAATDSLKKLTETDGEDIIYRLRKLQGDNYTPRSSKVKHKPTAKGVSAEQQRKVWALMYELKSLDIELIPLTLGERLCAIIRKELKTDCTPKNPFVWLGFVDCNKLIEILKRYIASAAKKKTAKG